MEIKISKNELLKGIQRTQSITTKSTTLPILTYILLNAGKGNLNIIGTDLEVGIKGNYQCSVKKEGSIATLSKKLFEIIREMPEEKEITMKLIENYWLKITCGNINYQIAGLNPEDFPKFPDIESDGKDKIKSGVLLDMIKKTSYAISNDDSRYNLSGLLWEFKEKVMNMVATDGHRLAKTTNSSILKPADLKIIIPRKGVYELRKILEEGDNEILFWVKDNHIIFKKDNLYLVIRLLETDFPEYEKVIPKKSTKSIIVKRNEMKESIKRVSLMSNERSKAVKMSVKKDEITLSSSDPEIGQASDILQAKYDSEEIAVGFNAKYFLDILESVDDEELVIGLNDSLSPCVIKGLKDQNYVCVLMPMRV